MSNVNIQFLQAIKAAIKLSIIDKGVTVGDDFTTYANGISQIKGGLLGKDKAGALGRYLLYCLDNPTVVTRSSFYQTYKNSTTTLVLGKLWDLTSNSSGSSNSDGFSSVFYQNGNLYCIDLKLIGTHRGNYSRMFSGCLRLYAANIDFNNRVRYVDYNGSHSRDTFFNCIRLEFAYIWNFNGDCLENFFHTCTALKVVKMTNSSGGYLTNRDINGMFFNCPSLVQIDGLDLSTVKEIPNGNETGKNAFYSTGRTTSTMFNNPTLRFMRLKNLGKNDVNYGYNFNSKQYLLWGIEDLNEPLSKNARLSLIDTLITYSCDRIAEGYTNTCTLSLYSTTKALLTDVEIALITSKGFTLA